MSKFAYFDPRDGRILQWIDTDAMSYNLPDASMLHGCSDGDWMRQFSEVPQMVKNDVIVDYVPSSSTKAELQAAAWSGIKAERDRRKSGGVQIEVGGVAKWFHTDDGSRIQQIGLAMMGSNLPAGLQWKTLDGSFVTMTPQLAQSVFTAVAASDQAIFGAAEKHRVAMESAADPSAYDYSGGWPKIYGE